MASLLPAIWALGHGGSLVTATVLAADGTCGSKPSTLTRCRARETSNAAYVWAESLARLVDSQRGSQVVS
ncbi:hypothetical protein GQ600_21868 [Phytophthora cactorum]|nr:hypothetical protein GQ600_21868 [Phytophthora cactorum]